MNLYTYSEQQKQSETDRNWTCNPSIAVKIPMEPDFNWSRKLYHWATASFLVWLWNSDLVYWTFNWVLAGFRSGEHNLYHSSYTDVYGYRDPVVWPWFSCVWVTLPFSQGPNSENTSPLYTLHKTPMDGASQSGTTNTITWSEHLKRYLNPVWSCDPKCRP